MPADPNLAKAARHVASKKLNRRQAMPADLVAGIVDVVAFVDQAIFATPWIPDDDRAKFESRWLAHRVEFLERDTFVAERPGHFARINQPGTEVVRALRRLARSAYLAELELAIDVVCDSPDTAKRLDRFVATHRAHLWRRRRRTDRGIEIPDVALIVTNPETGRTEFYSAHRQSDRVTKSYRADAKAHPDVPADLRCLRIEERLKRRALLKLGLATALDLETLLDDYPQVVAFWKRRLRLRAWDLERLGRIVSPRSGPVARKAKVRTLLRAARTQYLNRLDQIESSARSARAKERRAAIDIAPVAADAYQPLADFLATIGPRGQRRKWSRPRRYFDAAFDIDASALLPRRLVSPLARHDRPFIDDISFTSVIK